MSNYRESNHNFRTMSQVRLIMSILILLLIVSCEYEPKGLYERDLQPMTSPPDLDVLELDLPLDQDTVLLPYYHIWFHFGSPGHEVSWIKWYVDASGGEIIMSDNGFFELPYYIIPDTWHTLRIEVYVASGTGSLADSLGMEGKLFFVREWVIKTLGTTYRNVTASEKEGFLRLRWPPAGGDPVEYTIYFNNSEVGRTTECEFTDKGYVGQEGTYMVIYPDPANGNRAELHGWIELTGEYRIGWQSDTENNYYITFDKPVYYAAIDTLVLVGFNDGYSRLEKDWTTDLEQGRFVLPDSLFGISREYWMVVVPKYKNTSYSPNYNYSSPFATPRITVRAGYPSPAFGGFFPVSADEIVFHGLLPGGSIYRDYLFRYSLAEETVVDYVGEPSPDPFVSGIYFRSPAVSPDGNYYTAGIRLTQSAILGSAHNLTEYKVVDITEASSPAYTSKMPVSNIGTGIILSTEAKYLYDFRNEVILASVNDSGVLSGHGISPDGEFFFLRYPHQIYLYSWRNGTLTLEHEPYQGDSPFFDLFTFFGNEPGMAAGWDASTKTFYKIRCSDLGIVNSFPLPAEEILDIDYYNDMILCFSPYLLTVHSLNDGTLLYRVPVSYSFVWSGMLRLHGRSIFHNEGARYFLK